MAVTETPSWSSTSWKKLRCCRRSSNSSAPSTCVPRAVRPESLYGAPWLGWVGRAGGRKRARREATQAANLAPARRVCKHRPEMCVRFDGRAARLKGWPIIHQDVEQRLRTAELTDGLQVAIELHELIHGHEHALQHERLRSREGDTAGLNAAEGRCQHQPGAPRAPPFTGHAPPTGGPVAVCGGPRMHAGAPHALRATPRAFAAADTRRQTREWQTS